MKTANLWNITPCGMVDIDQRFRRAYCIHHQGDIYKNKWHSIQEGNRLVSQVLHLVEH
jgi:hypothetical protein